MTCTIRIRGERAEFISVTLQGRSHPTSEDFWDGNWLRARVEVAAGGFRGDVSGELRTEELVEFHRQILRLVGTLVGEANFTTREGWLKIRATGNGRGQMDLRSEVRDRPGDGNSLVLRLELDQTYLTLTAGDLVRAVKLYPVIGRAEP